MRDASEPQSSVCGSPSRSPATARLLGELYGIPGCGADGSCRCAWHGPVRRSQAPAAILPLQGGCWALALSVDGDRGAGAWPQAAGERLTSQATNPAGLDVSKPRPDRCMLPRERTTGRVSVHVVQDIAIRHRGDRRRRSLCCWLVSTTDSLPGGRDADCCAGDWKRCPSGLCAAATTGRPPRRAIRPATRPLTSGKGANFLLFHGVACWSRARTPDSDK